MLGDGCTKGHCWPPLAEAFPHDPLQIADSRLRNVPQSLSYPRGSQLEDNYPNRAYAYLHVLPDVGTSGEGCLPFLKIRRPSQDSPQSGAKAVEDRELRRQDKVLLQTRRLSQIQAVKLR